MSHWYPIATMKTAHVPVRIRRTGFEVLAEIRKHPRLSDVGRPVWWWYEIKPSGSLVALAAVGIEEETGWDAWQPPDARHWPSPLPEPLSSQMGAVAWQSPPPLPEPEDGTEQGDGWPYPGLRLGVLVPPRHLEECEARLLRAIRTMRSPAVAGIVGASGYAGDIPRETIKIILQVAAAERVAEDGDNELAAVRSAWAPTRRDITDWSYCAEWLNGVSKRARSVLYLRSDDPPPSYTEITRYLGGSPQGMHQLYHSTVERIYRRVGIAR